MRAATSKYLAHLVVGIVTLSLITVAFGRFLIGTLGISLALFVAFISRLVQPDNRPGWLVVRSRKLDCTTLLLLFVAVTVLALKVPQPA